MIDEYELGCKAVQDSLWDYAAGEVESGTRENVAAHLYACRECDADRAEVRLMRAGLRSLPVKKVPSMLKTQLQVIASRESSRRRRRQDIAARIAEIRSSVKLFFDNLLRPFAVPAAGGILTSILCFGIIGSALHVHPDWTDDIPVRLFTQVTMDEASPFACIGKDVMVQLTVDEDGNVSDFSVPHQGNPSPDELQEIGNLVLYSRFTPATAFGQRVSGKILVDISHIQVKG